MGHVARRFKFLTSLLKQGIGSKLLAGLWTIWAYASFARDEILMPEDDKAWKAKNMLLAIPEKWWLAIPLLLSLIWLFEASLTYSKKIADENAELKKVDKDDLQRMLGGMFLHDTFMYGGDINLCKEYKGKFEFGQFRDKFTNVVVRAPKNSWAGIRFHFNGSHQIPQAKYQFYILDHQGNEKAIEDIYSTQQIYLDENAGFSFKMTYDENFQIDEGTMLRIAIQTWAK